MTGYIELLNLTISHPYIDAGSWSMIPGARAEHYLALSGLKAAFSRGRLSLRGPADFPNLLDDGPLAPGSRQADDLCFFFFCGDPYLIRASDWPVYQPGCQVLYFYLKDLETVFSRPRAVDFPEDLAAEASLSRRKYLGRVFGPPPFGLVRLPPVRRPPKDRGDGVVEPLSLQLPIEPRLVYWIYRIVPKLKTSLVLTGGPVRFDRREADEAWLFISETPAALSPAGVRGLSLMLADSDSADGFFPVLENLPSPALRELAWNKDLNSYAATVTVDLSRFSLLG